MYQQAPPPGETDWQVPRRGWRAVSGTVWALGLTSFVTDISSEMITSVLPAYLVLYRQMTPLTYGAIDGLYQALAGTVRIASGVVADRWHRHKTVAVAGYAVSAIAKLVYLAGAAWPVMVTAVTFDRLGKGLRTAPRDAMIATATAPALTATAFGLHRSFDAAGAALRPLPAFALLTAVPGGYDQVFLASFVCALVGVAALVLLVDPPPTPSNGAPPSILGHAGAALKAPGFGRLTIAAALLSLVSISDGLVYLVAQQQTAFTPARLPLLFVGTQAAYFLLAGPFGALADRLGARTMFLAGHVVLVTLYLILWRGIGSTVGLAGVMLGLGAYYAATDGVLPAMASRHLPAHVRASGLGLLATSTTTARGAAALLFGALWTWTSASTAMALFVGAGALGVAAASLLLPTANSTEPAA